MVLQSNEYTSWVVEHLVKEKKDIELIAEFATAPKCDVEAVNREAEAFGQRGIIRGHICCFDVFGQPGTWQNACCLFGTENMILAAYDDPGWVHAFLKILQSRKKTFIRSLKGARHDILELGGGSASTTVISPRLFEKFVMPYDAELIDLAHRAGQRIVYHNCGGMMPILEQIAAMQPDAMETFTPPEMGGDVDLAEARRRLGNQMCMIGGFDQFHFSLGCSPDETRAAVRRCFEAAGQSGGIRRAKVQTGETVATIGQGLIGYLAAQAAKVHGVRVIAIDRLPEQLEMARKAGADFTLNPVEGPIRNRVSLSSRLGGESFRHKEGNQP